MEIIKVIQVSFENYIKLVSVVCHCNHMAKDPGFDLDSLLSDILNPIDQFRSLCDNDVVKD